MEPVFLILAILTIIVAIVVGFLQFIVPFVKKEVKFTNKFPFVASTTPAATTTAATVKVDTATYAKNIAEKFPLPEGRKPIAVMPFTNLTGEASLDYLSEAIPNLLITNLEQSQNLSVMTWERMQDLLEMLGRKEVKIVDNRLGFELCKLDGINNIIVGIYTKAGDMFATDVKVLDVSTKRLLKTAKSKAKGIDSILESQIDELSKDISLGVGLSAPKIEETGFRVADVTTDSMEAYSYFLRGRDEFEKLHPADARRLLQKAVELDSTFAMAYLYLGLALSHLKEIKAMQEAFEKAKQFSKKTTERERLFIMAYYTYLIEKKREKGFSIIKQVIRKYPKEKRAYYDVGNTYHNRGEYQDAIAWFNKALELDPNYSLALNDLAYAYAATENYDKAVKILKKLASILPRDANVLDTTGEIYEKMGRIDEALAKFKQAIRIKPEFGSYHKIIYNNLLKEDYSEIMKWVDRFIMSDPSLHARKVAGYLLKGFYYYWLGCLNQSLTSLDEAANIMDDDAYLRERTTVHWIKAWVYYEKADYESCKKSLETCASYPIKDYPAYKTAYNLFLGFVDLANKHIDSAKKKLDEVRPILSDVDWRDQEWVLFCYNLLNAEICLAEGSMEKSIVISKQMTPLNVLSTYAFRRLYRNLPYSRDILARAYIKNGDLDKAIAEYERLFSFDPTSKERRLVHPKFHYRLAKLYEEKELKDSAIVEYEKFLEIWKDADKDILELQSARKRLGKLKTID